MCDEHEKNAQRAFILTDKRTARRHSHLNKERSVTHTHHRAAPPIELCVTR